MNSIHIVYALVNKNFSKIALYLEDKNSYIYHINDTTRIGNIALKFIP